MCVCVDGWKVDATGIVITIFTVHGYVFPIRGFGKYRACGGLDGWMDGFLGRLGSRWVSE